MLLLQKFSQMMLNGMLVMFNIMLFVGLQLPLQGILDMVQVLLTQELER